VRIILSAVVPIVKAEFNNSPDPMLLQLLQHTAAIERKVDYLSSLLPEARQWQHDPQHEDADLGNFNGEPTPSQIQDNPVSQSNTDPLQTSSTDNLIEFSSAPSPFGHNIPVTSKTQTRHGQEAAQHGEEISVLCSHPHRTEIMPLIENFFVNVCPLFPIICDKVILSMAQSVAARGFKDDLPSCLTLAIMSLAKAYSPKSANDQGMAEFQSVARRLVILRVQFTLEVAQTQILCALFLSKSGQLLDSWVWLHAGCTTLHTMIKRYENKTSNLCDFN
jgi:hypothetical protein